MEFVADWEPTPKRGPFAGIWIVRCVPDNTSICVSEAQLWSKTKEGLSEQLQNMGNGHPVRWPK